MKILIVSDMIDPFVYSSSISEMFGYVDCVLCAGDLSMDYIDFIVSTLNKPTYFVFGNHNLKELKYFHKEARKEALKFLAKLGIRLGSRHDTCSANISRNI